MNSCVKCGKELPETAIHCVFCGARQAGGASQASPPQAEGDPRQTAMGLLTDELIADLQKPEAPQPQGRPPAAAPPPQSARPPGQPAQPGPSALPADVDLASAKTIGVSGQLTRDALGLPEPPPAAPPHGSPPAQPAPGHHPPPAQPAPGHGPPPAQYPPQGARPGPFEVPPAPGHSQAGGYGAPGGFDGPRPNPFESPAGAPPPGAPPPGHPPGAPAGNPAQMQTIIGGDRRGFGAPPAMPAADAAPAGPAMNGPATVALSPVGGAPPSAAPHTPPFLASQTMDRMGAPQEPWADLLGTLMLVLGIALIACFVMPWSITDDVAVFSWTRIADAPGVQKLEPLLIVLTGLTAVGFGLVPMATRLRGIAAGALGFTAIAVTILIVRGWSWGNPFDLIAAVSLVSGLLLRSQYQRDLLARVLVTLGVFCTLLSLLIPRGGEVALVSHFEALGGDSARLTVVALFRVLWDILPLFALLCWLPAPGRAGAHVFAWLFIAQPVLVSVFTVLVTPHPAGLGAALQGGLHTFFLGPMAMMAWLALLGYGLATVIGKQLEHQ